MIAWVSFRDLISPTADFAKALKLFLCLITYSCWRWLASCFWALWNCAWWLSMKAAEVSTSSIDSGSLPSNSSKMARIGCAFLTNWPMSWFRNWRDSWSLALISSIVRLIRPMLLLLLLPGRWLQFGKKTDYCLEILVPERKVELGWPMETKEWWNRLEERCLLALGLFPLCWNRDKGLWWRTWDCNVWLTRWFR